MRRFSLTGCFPSKIKNSKNTNPPSLPAPPNPLPRLSSPRRPSLPEKGHKNSNVELNSTGSKFGVPLSQPNEHEIPSIQSIPIEEHTDIISTLSISSPPTVAGSVTPSEFDVIYLANSPEHIFARACDADQGEGNRKIGSRESLLSDASHVEFSGVPCTTTSKDGQVDFSSKLNSTSFSSESSSYSCSQKLADSCPLEGRISFPQNNHQAKPKRRWSVCSPRTGRVAQVASAWDSYFNPSLRKKRNFEQSLCELSTDAEFTTLDSCSNHSSSSSNTIFPEPTQSNKRVLLRPARIRNRRYYTIDSFSTPLPNVIHTNSDVSVKRTPKSYWNDMYQDSEQHQMIHSFSLDFTKQLVHPNFFSDSSATRTPTADTSSSTETLSGKCTPTEQYPGCIAPISLDTRTSDNTLMNSHQEYCAQSTNFRPRSVSTPVNPLRPCAIAVERHQLIARTQSTELNESSTDASGGKSGVQPWQECQSKFIGQTKVITEPANENATFLHKPITSGPTDGQVKANVIPRAPLPPFLLSDTVNGFRKVSTNEDVVDQRKTTRSLSATTPPNLTPYRPKLFRSVSAVKLNLMWVSQESPRQQIHPVPLNRNRGIYKRETNNVDNNPKRLESPPVVQSPALSPASRKYEEHVRAQRQNKIQTNNLQPYQRLILLNAHRYGSVSTEEHTVDEPGPTGCQEVEHMDPQLWRDKLNLIAQWQQDVQNAMQFATTAESCSTSTQPCDAMSYYTDEQAPHFHNMIPNSPPLAVQMHDPSTPYHATFDELSTENPPPRYDAVDNRVPRSPKLPVHALPQGLQNQQWDAFNRVAPPTPLPYPLIQTTARISGALSSHGPAKSNTPFETNQAPSSQENAVIGQVKRIMKSSREATKLPTAFVPTMRALGSEGIQSSPWTSIRRFSGEQSTNQPMRSSNTPSNDFHDYPNNMKSPFGNGRPPLLTLRDIQLSNNLTESQTVDHYPIYEGMENWVDLGMPETTQWTRVPVKSRINIEPPKNTVQTMHSWNPSSPLNSPHRRTSCDRPRRRSITRLELSVPKSKANNEEVGNLLSANATGQGEKDHIPVIPRSPLRRAATISPDSRRPKPCVADELVQNWPPAVNTTVSSGFVSAASISVPQEEPIERTDASERRVGMNLVNGLPPAAIPTTNLATNRNSSNLLNNLPRPTNEPVAPIHRFMLGRSASNEMIYIETETPFALSIDANQNEICITKATPAGSRMPNDLTTNKLQLTSGKSVPVRLRLSFGSESNLNDNPQTSQCGIPDQRFSIATENVKGLRISTGEDPCMRSSLPCIPQERLSA